MSRPILESNRFLKAADSFLNRFKNHQSLNEGAVKIYTNDMDSPLFAYGWEDNGRLQLALIHCTLAENVYSRLFIELYMDGDLLKVRVLSENEDILKETAPILYRKEFWDSFTERVEIEDYLDVIEPLQEVPHRGFNLLFTPSEEPNGKGAGNFQLRQTSSKTLIAA